MIGKNYRLTPNRRLGSIQESSDFMKTARATTFRTGASMLLLGLVVALMGNVGVASADGNNKNKHKDNHDNGHYDNRDHGHHGKREYRSHEYHERVYLPPPVIYAPPPPPGIGIFFPPIFIHP
jgi:hypothetical protein